MKPLLVALLAILFGAVVNPSSQAQPARADDAPIRRVLDDYIGLYRADTLPQWKALFLPGFVASYTNEDGSVTSRTLDDFYTRQKGAFDGGAVSETLHGVRIERVGRLAHVFADFRFTSRGAERPGRLMLLMIEDRGQFRIAALAFTYHLS
jgi:hypothetical protein